MTRVKICGLTRVQDAALAYRLGAWALGFVFHPSSPRAVETGAVRAILRELPADARGVGVFVNAGIDVILDAVAQAGLRGVQLHGDETPEFARSLRERLPGGVLMLKALRLGAESDLPLLSKFGFCDAIVVESAAAGTAYGGSGLVGDWNVAARAAGRAQVILAGGLNPRNILAAVEAVRPAGVDVSSGVEESPGIKSHPAMAEFFEGVRHAAR